MLHVQTNEFLKDGFHWEGDTKQIEGMDQLFIRKHLQNILMKLSKYTFQSAKVISSSDSRKYYVQYGIKNPESEILSDTILYD